ncbi:MAG: SDR family NAD(P)-dependent oxidoreductase [Dermatophilaceae bacterium]
MSDTDLTRVAVIGMAGRFPGASDVDALWRLLCRGEEGLTRLTEQVTGEHVHEGPRERADEVPVKGVLEDADRFDAAFFGVNPREAELLDPQHRVLLECAWHALEDAGLTDLDPSIRVGVFAGASLNTYLLHNLSTNPALVESVGMYQTLLASDKDFLATRVAYKLGLTGPAVTVQTACSTSLVAVHLACQSLIGGECDIALAGGVSVTAPLRAGYRYEPGGILSPDGHCRPFDAAAQGTVPGNGVGLVVLRRLADARDAGDRIDAIVLGSAVNNDGSAKVGYTAPSVHGQAAVIAEALAIAGIEPGSVGAIEAHGTGTPLGDPIECAALREAYAGATPNSIALGSIKGTVGHLDAAAGVAGLVKAVLQLREGQVVPVAGFTEANPQLELDASPFRIADRLAPWPLPGPRRASVSSFGMGGTNVHVVLEQGPPRVAPVTSQVPAELALLLSAKSPDSLRRYAAVLADTLEAGPRTALPAVAATLGHRRRRLGTRWAAVVGSVGEAVGALRGLAATGPSSPAEARPRARAAFLFPGQGAQYAGMGRELYGCEPAVRDAVDRCASLFLAEVGEDLRALVFGAGDQVEARLAQTRLTQPAMFLLDYAMACGWQARGVEPAALAGHSIGEYVAAYVSGVMTLEDAVRLVAARGLLVQGLATGSMLSVALPEDAVRGWLGHGVDLAAVNSTAQCIVSGADSAISDLASRLATAQVAHRRLRTSHAFHSAAMDPAVPDLVELARGVRLRPPRIPFVSNVTGRWITPEEATDPRYWGRHLRAPVRFADAVALLLADPDLVPVEAGPGTTLTSLVTSHADWEATRVAVSSLAHPRARSDERRSFRTAVATAWTQGLEPDLSPELPTPQPPVRLPGYRFGRDRFWVEPADTRAASTRPAGPTGRTQGIQVRSWERVVPELCPGPDIVPEGSKDAAPAPAWLVLSSGDPRSDEASRALAGILTAQGAELDRALERLDDTDRLAALLSAHDPAVALRIVVVTLPTAAAAPGRQHRDAFALVTLLQALAAQRPAVRCRIDVVTDALHPVTGEEALEPSRALLTGPVVVGPQEVNGLTAHLLDVGPDPVGPIAAPVLGRLADALRSGCPERQLALRGRHWWAPRVQPVSWDVGPTRLRDAGAYLITGGLGGMGLALAGHIAASVTAPTLVLAGRHVDPLDPATQQTLDTLRQRGARVLVRALDVCDGAAVAALVAEIHATVGALHGVVHAAGLAASGPLTGLTAERVGTVVAPKADGTKHLWQSTRGEPLDLFVVCSSVTAVLGGPGQLDYCSANAIADCTVAAGASGATGSPAAVSICWGTWRDTGMATGRTHRTGGRPTAHPLLRAIGSEPGTARYAVSFSTERDWVVADHRLMGHGLVPGTAYLDLVVAAVRDATGHEGAVELSDVVFLSPLVVPDGSPREAQLVLTGSADAWTAVVSSLTDGTGPASDHARLTIRLHPARAARVEDLDGVLARCQVTEDLTTEAEFRDRLRTSRFEKGAGPLQFAFGPRWQTLRRIRTGGERMLATLTLPDELAADIDAFPLHPALLDLAGGIFRIHAPDSHYLPLAYRSVRIEHPLTRTVHVSVVIRDPHDMSGETIGCDLTLLDPQGTVLVEISGFTIKRINDVDALARTLETVVATASGAAPSPSQAGADGLLGPLTAAMSRTDALAAFERILRAPVLPEQVYVFPGDLADALAASRALTPELLAEQAAGLVPAVAHPRPALPTPYVAPRTEIERQVAAVWQEVLGLDEVGVDDDFFAVGGHSLAAVQIGTRLQQTVGVELDLNAFFESPTIAAAAAAIGERTRSPSDGERIPVLARSVDPPGPAADVDALSDAEVEQRLAELLATDPSWSAQAPVGDDRPRGELR